MARDVRFVRSAEDDLAWYRKNEQQLVYDAAIRLLRNDADVETKKRKRLRPNRLAPWNCVLAVRVFYEVGATRSESWRSAQRAQSAVIRERRWSYESGDLANQQPTVGELLKLAESGLFTSAADARISAGTGRPVRTRGRRLGSSENSYLLSSRSAAGGSSADEVARRLGLRENTKVDEASARRLREGPPAGPALAPTRSGHTEIAARAEQGQVYRRRVGQSGPSTWGVNGNKRRWRLKAGPAVPSAPATDRLHQ